MPIYTYTAKPHPYKTIHGEIEAESEQGAINKLTKMGCFPISLWVKTLSPDKQRPGYLGKISNRDLVLFTGQLAGLIEGGVNIVKGINIITNQARNKYLKAVLDDVTARIKDGKFLSDSLAAHPDLFSGFYTSMVHTGEASGNLRFTLRRLADFLEEQQEFKDSLRAGLIYPFFILIVGAVTVFVLLAFVIPRLITMFEDMGQALPLPTRILISASEFLRGYGWLIAAVIFILIFLFRRINNNPPARIFLDRFKLKLWLFGEIILKAEISRLMRILALLISGGIPLISSLEISSSIVKNQVLKSEIKNFKEQINNGASLSIAFKSSWFFPELVTSVVAIGEETGTLDKALKGIAQDYEKEVNRTLKAMSRLLEPAIILVMGLVVGFIVLSMLLPIFEINLIVR